MNKFQYEKRNFKAENMNLLQRLFGSRKTVLNKPVVISSLQTSWVEIWCDWLRAEKYKTDVTFSLWLQENYNVPSKKQ